MRRRIRPIGVTRASLAGAPLGQSVGLGIYAHRPELQDLELLAVLADAALAVDDRAAVAELDPDRRGDERGSEEKPDPDRTGDVEHPLRDRRRRSEARMHDVPEPRAVDGPDRNVPEQLLVELVRGDHLHREVEAEVGDRLEHGALLDLGEVVAGGADEELDVLVEHDPAHLAKAPEPGQALPGVTRAPDPARKTMVVDAGRLELAREGERERAVTDHGDPGAGDLVDPVPDPGAEREDEPGADDGGSHVGEADRGFEHGHREDRRPDADDGRDERQENPRGRKQAERER